MNKPIVVLGIGELGSVFSRAFLRNNYPVFPITRDTNIDEVKQSIDPEMILVCTAENDLQSALKSIPDEWKDRVAMMQNELLPRDWEDHQFINPTVISVWFEKKKGMDSKVLIPSPAFGPKAKILVESLQKIDISARELLSADSLLFELILKNLYILTTNISGLAIKPGASVKDLYDDHFDLMMEVMNDIIKIQSSLTGTKLIAEDFEKSLREAFDGDPDHKCMGRSAPQRLQRALELATEFQIETPVLKKINNL
jgi:hypothetical protein